MPSLLRERLGPRVRDGDGSPVRSGSPVAYLLRAEPSFVKTVSAALALAIRHPPPCRHPGAGRGLFEHSRVAKALPLLEQLGAAARRVPAFAGKTRDIG